MKALLCSQFGPIDALRIEELASPVPGPGQVVIAIKAAGVNFPDTLIVQGKYQVRPSLPFSPGGEFAGVVKAVGAGVTTPRVGDRVIGLSTHGGFAEEAVVDATATVPIPDSVGFDAASAIVFAHGTALHALKDRARLQRNETLLVLGAAGGVGLAAVDIGRMVGATVIAAASNAEKLSVCRERGADHTIDYSCDDLRERVRALTEGRGADVVYDPVGGELSEPALRATAWNGRFLVIGFASGTIPRIPLNLPLLKGAAIVGVYWGEFVRREPERNAENMRTLLRGLAEGALSPRISARYALADAVDALRALERRAVTGKVVVVP